MKLKRKHHLDAGGKGYFPVGAVAMSEGAKKAFAKEVEISATKERLPDQGHTLGKKVSEDTIRDTYLYLHKMEQFGKVSDDQKNHNVYAIGMGMGTVKSRYPLPLSEVDVEVHTKFDPVRQEVRTAIMLKEELE